MHNPPLIKWTRQHPPSQVIGLATDGVLTRAQQKIKDAELRIHADFCMFHVFISKVEPTNVKIALQHSDWIEAMQAELAEFERNKNNWQMFLQKLYMKQLSLECLLVWE